MSRAYNTPLMSRWIAIFIVLLLGFLAAACAPAEASPTPEEPSPVPSTPTFTEPPVLPTSTFTSIPPTNSPTPTLLPTATQEPSPTTTLTATSSPTASAASTSSGYAAGSITAADPLRIYLIELKPGKGCNDSVVPVKINANRTRDVDADIETALKTLLGNKSEYWGSLYNPVFRSTLNVNNVEVNGDTAYIWLTGRYIPSKDRCDNSRVKAQIWSTIRQFRDITRPIIYLNKALLGDILSNDN